MQRKRSFSRKALSLLLAVMLMLAITPTTVFAASTGFSYVSIGSTSITNEATWTSTKNGGTITWDAATATLTLDNADLSNWSLNTNTSGIIVNATDTTRTVTIKLIGANTIGTKEKSCVGSSVWVNTNTVLEAADGASLNIYGSDAIDNRGNGFYINGNLSVKGGTLDLTSAYPALYTDKAISIEGGNIKASVMTDGSAIYGYAGIAIKGENTVVTTESLYCALICRENDITISDGATFDGTTTGDSIVYNPAGNITISDATVTLNSEFGGSTGLFVDNSDGSVVIENSNLTINSDSTAIFTGDKDVTITDSVVNLTSANGNSINAWGKLTIKGDKTVITANSKFPMYSWDVFTMTGGAVSSTTTDGTAMSSTRGISITGGSVNAKTSAKMSALYAANGEIVIDGANTVLNAESTQDSAIFARNGQITLNSPNITAKAAEGFPAIVARQYSQTGTEETISPKIAIGSENLTVQGTADLAVTQWAATGNTSGKELFYSDSVFVTKGTASPIADLTNALQNVSVVYKDADYTAVNNAIAAANALKADDYKDFSAVTAAINAVVTGKNITEQTTVDGYAEAIENAIKALVYKDADYSKVNAALEKANALKADDYKDFSAVTAAINAVVTGKNITEQTTVDGYAEAIENAINALVKKESSTSSAPSDSTTSSTPDQDAGTDAPETGNTNNMLPWVAILLVSGGALTLLGIRKKREQSM